MNTTTHYQRIVAAIDLEHEPEKVISRAAQLGQPKQTSIEIIHIVTPINDALYASGLSLLPPVIDVDKLQNQAVDAASKKLNELIALFPDHEIGYKVILGQPAAEIIKAADSFNADLIIIGSHGKHGIQLLLGSTATAVLHHAKCDTLALRL